MALAVHVSSQNIFPFEVLISLIYHELLAWHYKVHSKKYYRITEIYMKKISSSL